MYNLYFESYSKINLGLKVLNKRLDGFHNINSIFIQTNFSDKLFFKKSKIFQLSCDDNKVPIDNSNTICKAYQILNHKFKFKNHYRIHLNKNIPIGAGLGGGSSNAACTLLALTNLLNLGISSKYLHKIASDIGSDVPFFFYGGVKLVEGRGEIIKQHVCSLVNQLYFYIIIPKFQVSTTWAYAGIKKSLEDNINNVKFPPLTNKVNWEFFNNDFEKVVGSTYPEIFEIKKLLYDSGALYSGLSGSGSAVFGIYTNKKFIEEIQNKLNMYQTFIASPI